MLVIIIGKLIETITGNFWCTVELIYNILYFCVRLNKCFHFLYECCRSERVRNLEESIKVDSEAGDILNEAVNHSDRSW